MKRQWQDFFSWNDRTFFKVSPLTISSDTRGLKSRFEPDELTNYQADNETVNTSLGLGDLVIYLTHVVGLVRLRKFGMNEKLIIGNFIMYV